MTQEFEFETDDIQSLMKMLDTIGNILFDKTKIIISQKAEDFNFCFDDGKYDEFEKYSVFRKSVIEPDRIELGVDIYRERDYFNKEKDAIECAASLNRGITKQPKRKFLMCIATNSSDYKNVKKYASFKNGQRYIEDTLSELLDDPDVASFEKECGNGYNECFDSQDGSVGIGYRLNWSPCGGEDRLHISLVHMYYGK